jgi:exosortase
MMYADARAWRSSLGLKTALFALLILGAYWFVILDLLRQLLEDPNYAYGLFVPALALLLAVRRRERFRRAEPGSSALGLVLILLGGLVYLFGVLASEHFTSRISMIPVLGGAFLVLQGRARTRVMIFPILFLALMVPLPYIIYYKITFPLQLLSSRLAESLITAIGIPVQRWGNMLKLEGYTLEVVTACSGLRSMMTLGTLAVFMSEFLDLKWRMKLLFVVLSVPVAVTANTLRLTFTAALASLSDAAAADEFLHDFSGLVVFVLGAILLAALGMGFEWLEKRA